MGWTTRKTLEFQAACIDDLMLQHRITARVTGGTVTPRFIQFRMLLGLGTKIARVKGLTEELALTLNAPSCRVSRQGGYLAVEIPRPDPEPVHLLRLQKRLNGREIPFGSAVLGLAQDGAPLLVRLPSPDVTHLLVAGTTGSGKTALVRTIVVSLALAHKRRHLGFVLIDPKGRAFGPLTALPHLLRPVAQRPEDAADLMSELVKLMLKRDRNGWPPKPRVVVVIDELADLLMTSPRAQLALTRLTQRGREAGIHLIACTQKPASQVLGSLAKANFPVRLVGRVTSPEDARCAAGVGGSGAERLSGLGDFVVVAGGQVTRFQAAYVPRRELAEVVNQIRQQV